MTISHIFACDRTISGGAQFLLSCQLRKECARNLKEELVLPARAGLGGKASDPEAFEAYAKYLEEAPVTTLRDMLQYKSDRKPVALEEVESIETILNRFCTGGMSLGAISRECHETIAVAMNRIGGKSNSGEGGEDVLRFSQVQDVDNEGRSQSFAHLNGLKNGDIAFSSIKQVRGK